MVISAESVKRCMDAGDQTLLTLAQELHSTNDLTRRLWVVDEVALTKMRTLKPQFLAEGPSPDIDVETEYELGIRKRPE